MIDPRDKPAYFFSEAARFIDVPLATLRAWFLGYSYTSPNGTSHLSKRLIAPASKDFLSFSNLVEAHVLRAIRRKHKVPPQKVRSALEYMKKQLEHNRPLLTAEFQTDGLDLFVSRFEELLNVSSGGQIELKEMIQSHLKRVERDSNGIPIKLFPFLNSNNPSSKPIVLNPSIAFGRPVVAGSSVPVAILVERFKAGDSIDELVYDYNLERKKVEDAFRFDKLAA